MKKTVDQIVEIVLDVALFVIAMLEKLSDRRKKRSSSPKNKGDA